MIISETLRCPFTPFRVSAQGDMRFTYNPPMANPSARKTYFGAAALLTASLAFASLVVHFVAAYLRISPSLFSQLNGLTTQFYCMTAPLALTLGVLGIFFKNDSKPLAWAALALVAIPFLIILTQFVLALVTYN